MSIEKHIDLCLTSPVKLLLLSLNCFCSVKHSGRLRTKLINWTNTSMKNVSAIANLFSLIFSYIERFWKILWSYRRLLNLYYPGNLERHIVITEVNILDVFRTSILQLSYYKNNFQFEKCRYLLVNKLIQIKLHIVFIKCSSLKLDIFLIPYLFHVFEGLCFTRSRFFMAQFYVLEVAILIKISLTLLKTVFIIQKQRGPERFYRITFLNNIAKFIGNTCAEFYF